MGFLPKLRLNTPPPIPRSLADEPEHWRARSGSAHHFGARQKSMQGARYGRYEPRGPYSPRGRRRAIQAVLRTLGLEVRQRCRPAKGYSHRPIHAPRSGCSATLGKGIPAATPGSAAAGLVVSDIEAAHAELVGRGIKASEVWHGPPFPPDARLRGPDPKRTSYASFFSFNDPDGNTWLVQEVTTRLPGRT